MQDVFGKVIYPISEEQKKSILPSVLSKKQVDMESIVIFIDAHYQIYKYKKSNMC